MTAFNVEMALPVLVRSLSGELLLILKVTPIASYADAYEVQFVDSVGKFFSPRGVTELTLSRQEVVT